MNKLIDAVRIYCLYRRFGNSTKHAATAAWHIAIQKLPF